MLYFIVFILLSLFSIIFFYKTGKKNYSFAYLICLMLFILIAGLRYEIGVDFFAYREHFEESITLKLLFDEPRIFIQEFKENNWEFLSKIFFIVLRSISDNSQLLFLVSSIICSLLLFKSIRYFAEPKYFFFSLLIYFCFIYLFQEMHTMRQALGASFLYCAFVQKCKKNNIKALLFTLVAVGFHYAMMVFVPIIFFIDKQIKVKWQIIILFISFFVFVLNIRWMFSILDLASLAIPELSIITRLSTYTNADTFERPFFVTFILYLIPYIFLLRYNAKYHILSNNKYIIAQNVYFLYLVFTMVFWEFAYFSIRYGWICLWGMAICLPKTIECFKRNCRLVPICYILIFCYIVVSTFLFPDYTTGQFSPYQSYIETKWLGEKGTGKERVEKYMHEQGLEFNY